MSNTVVFDIPAGAACNLGPKCFSQNNTQILASNLIGGNVETYFKGIGVQAYMYDQQGQSVFTYPAAANARQLLLNFTFIDSGKGVPLDCQDIYTDQTGPDTWVIYADDYSKVSNRSDYQALTIWFQ